MYICIHIYTYIESPNFVSPEANHNQQKEQLFNVIKKKQISSFDKTKILLKPEKCEYVSMIRKKYEKCKKKNLKQKLKCEIIIKIYNI